MLEPVGFWSYARHDDQHSDGELSQLRVIVGKAIGLQYGAEVTLWQDVAAIPFGADWPETIERTLSQTTFFMPIITPRFLKSPNCRDEYVAFRQRMASLGRNDLVFPVHYVDVAGMSGVDTVFGDEFATLHRHQWIDFRPLFYTDPRSSEVKRWAGGLAKSILTTLRRPVPTKRDATGSEATGAPILVTEPTKAAEAGPAASARVDLPSSPVAVAAPLGDRADKALPVDPAKAADAPLLVDPRVSSPGGAETHAPLSLVRADGLSAERHGSNAGAWRQPATDTSTLDESPAEATDNATADEAAMLAPAGTAHEALVPAQAARDEADKAAVLAGNNRPEVDPRAEDQPENGADAIDLAPVAPDPPPPSPAPPPPAPDEDRVAAPARQTFWVGSGATRRAAIFGGFGLGAVAVAVGLTRSWFSDASRATLTGHSSSVTSVAFAPDGRTLASGSEDNTIKFWDAASGALQRTLEGNVIPVLAVHAVACASDGRTLASGGDDTIKLWDMASGALQRTLEGHSGSVYSVAFAPDGRTLASGSGDFTIKLWDAARGALRRTLNGHANTVMSVAFSPDGRTLASASQDNTIKLWDAASGTLRRTLEEFSGAVNSVAFSPDGRALASGSDKTIKLWDKASGDLRRTLEGHSGIIESVAVSPDGKTLASGSADNTIKLWDAASGAPLRTLEGHSNTVFSVAFSPDGRTLASGSADKTIKLWNVG